MSNQKQLIDELFVHRQTKFPRRTYTLYNLNDLAQIDLCSFERLARFNDRYKHLLVLVNCFSKKVEAYPLKSKKATEVLDAMKILLKRAKYKFANISSDAGLEFLNSQFLNFLKNQYRTNCRGVKKCVFVEAQNKRIKNLLYRKMMYYNSERWIDFLKETITELNNTPHSRLNIAANKITRKNEKRIFKKLEVLRLKREPKLSKIKFKLNEPVRIALAKYVFERSWHTRFYPEIYFIHLVNKKHNTYKLRDTRGKVLDRSFYSYELRKSNFPNEPIVANIIRFNKDKKKALVSFYGRRGDFWIDVNSLKIPPLFKP
jgi:hypothetical protein